MNSKLELLIAEINALPAEGKEYLIRMLTEALAAKGVRDSSAVYGPLVYGPLVYGPLSTGSSGMKAVTIVLPDELARRAQEAGLLSEARLAELIRGALKVHRDSTAQNYDATPQRRLVHRNGRLVAEALPGEQPISDAEVRALLNTMEW